MAAKLICTNCGQIHNDPGGNPALYQCSRCGHGELRRGEDKTGNMLIGGGLGGAVGGALGGPLGFAIGAAIGAFVGSKQ